MSGLWQKLTHTYDFILVKADPRVTQWFMATSPWPTVSVFLTYLAFVKWGPQMMKNRPPLKLRPLLLIYNLIQISLSFYMFKEFVLTAYQGGYDLRCQPMEYKTDALSLRMAAACWWFYFSKLVDLIDTVFFILTKKNDHLSYLHVYHHSTMTLAWWVVLRHTATGQTFFCAMLNSLVHTVMYTYYFLSALGPKVRKYLWWKRYLTQLQLIQFLLVMIHLSFGYINECPFPAWLAIGGILYLSSMIILFVNFYIQTYRKKAEQRRLRKSNKELEINRNHIGNGVNKSIQNGGPYANGVKMMNGNTNNNLNGATTNGHTEVRKRL